MGAEVREGRMSAREAQDARYKIGLKKESSYHSGYEKPLALGGAVFLCVCLSYFGGWRSPLGEYTERVGHTGDEKSIYSHEARFEHPARTWASVTHKQFSMQATTVATVNATYDWVAAEAKRVMREVLGVRAKDRRYTVEAYRFDDIRRLVGRAVGGPARHGRRVHAGCSNLSSQQ